MSVPGKITETTHCSAAQVSSPSAHKTSINLVAAGEPGKVARTFSNGKIPPPAAKILLIGEFSRATECQDLEQHMASLDHPGISVRLDQLEGNNDEEKIKDLELLAAALKNEGYIDTSTEIYVAVHGSKKGEEVYISTSDNKFEIETTRMLELLGRGKGSPASKGATQFSVCGSKALHKKLIDYPHHFIFYSGSHVIYINSSKEVLKKQIEFSHYHENRPPSPDDLLKNAEKLSGSNLVMSGNGKFRHIKIADKVKAGDAQHEAQLCRHLFYKFGTGSFTSVVRLLKKFNLNALVAKHPDLRALSPMAASSDKNASEKIILLLLLGMKIDIAEGNRSTALHHACAAGDNELIKCLLQNGVDPDLTNTDGNTASDLALENDWDDIAQIINDFSSGSRFPHYSPENLIFAFCHEGNREAMQVIIEGKRDWLTARDKKGNSLLLHSVNHRIPEISADLINAGIDPNLKNRKGDTALHRICIVDAPVGLLRQLRLKGANFNEKNNRGFTPLIYAARRGLTEHAKQLVRFTADINGQSLKGNTALHFAVSRNDVDMVKTLLDLGADRKIKNASGYSPMDRARRKGSSEITQLLKNYHPSEINFY